MAIRFVKKDLKEQFNDIRFDPKVRAIMLLANGYCEHRFGVALHTTSIFREGDLGVHGLWRGGDNDNDKLLLGEKKEIESYINWLFIYDSSRPKYKVCLLHTVPGRGGDHFHFQSHLATKLR